VIKKPRTRGGYSPARGLQNTNPQGVGAPVKKKIIHTVVMIHHISFIVSVKTQQLLNDLFIK
jgi:hypothetical protein